MTTAISMGAVLSWALLLAAQNASFTWVSRARNSGSDWYHAGAAVFSNGIWFIAFYYTFDFINMLKTAPLHTRIFIALVYVIATVFGSVFAGKLLRTYVERGKRRVGHYEDLMAEEDREPPMMPTANEMFATLLDARTAMQLAYEEGNDDED